MFERAPTTPGSIPLMAPISAVTQFNRFGYGPSFTVDHLAEKYTDQIPPLRITDLTVESYDATTKQVTLTWSCPLDNFGINGAEPGKSNPLITHIIIMRNF